MGFWTVFFTILKVLGIILGVIAALAAFIVLFLRFGSIRYRVTAAYDHDDPVIRIRLTLLYPVLYAFLNYENGKLDYDARFFRLSYFYDDIRKKKKRGKKKKKKKQRLPEEKRSIIDDAIDGIRGNKTDGGAPQENTAVKPPEHVGVQKQKKGLFKRLKELYHDIRQKLNVLRYYGKEVLMLFRDQDNREAVLFVLKTLKSIFAYIIAHKHLVRLRYGNEDPAKTAQWYGTFCAAAYMLGINLTTELDFEHADFAIDAYFRGYVKIYIVVKWILDLYRNDKLVDLIGKLS